MSEESNTWFRVILHFVLIAIVVCFLYMTYLLVKDLTFTRAYICFFVISVCIVLYYNYTLHWLLFDWMRRVEWEDRVISNQTDIIRSFIAKDFEKMEIEDISAELQTVKINFREKALAGLESKLKESIQKAEKILEVKKREKEILYLRYKKDELLKEMEEARRKKAIIEMSEEDRLEEIKNNLDLERNVYPIEDLTEEEVNILKEEEYQQSNEYDIQSKKIITALIKPVLNHTSTHTFLVWSTINFLEHLGIYEKIEEHKTRDADITFKYENKTFALEIETGNLLKKQKQLKQKVAYLNKKYKQRWMFIVSNKDLVASYRKYGRSTHRNGVEENLQKMLANI